MSSEDEKLAGMRTATQQIKDLAEKLRAAGKIRIEEAETVLQATRRRAEEQKVQLQSQLDHMQRTLALSMISLQLLMEP